MKLSISTSKICRRYFVFRYSLMKRKLTTQEWQQPLGYDTGIKLYNCIKRELVPVVLPNEKFASWYTCGPTVYDSAHLGHASCYVKLDIIQRILRQHFGINLVTAMNITDVDDKIIAKSNELSKGWKEISKEYEMEFWRDLRKLNVSDPNIKVRVTDFITEIVACIKEIMLKDKAYLGNDNSVYFDVKKFTRYGKLQKANQDDIKSSFMPNIKSSAADFALWKAKSSPKEPSWDSPWGAGRPGWHIECSALASAIFGKNIDFHAGGLDLKFPHHENEEAQSCVYHGTEQWTNYWIHTGHLNVKGQQEKMSKSLKNTISVDQLLAKYSADDFRMACVLSNYRNPVEYSDELMENSNKALEKFKSFRADCRAYLDGQKLGADIDSNEILQQLNLASVSIDSYFKQDFNTARAISVLSQLISTTSQYINNNIGSELISTNSLDIIAAVDNFVMKSLQNFGFQFTISTQSVLQHKESVLNLNALLDDIIMTRKIIREKAVALKNNDLFYICDDLRNCLKQHGIEIRDHNQGSSWSYNRTKKNKT